MREIGTRSVGACVSQAHEAQDDSCHQPSPQLRGATEEMGRAVEVSPYEKINGQSRSRNWRYRLDAQVGADMAVVTWAMMVSREDPFAIRSGWRGG